MRHYNYRVCLKLKLARFAKVGLVCNQSIKGDILGHSRAQGRNTACISKSPWVATRSQDGNANRVGNLPSRGKPLYHGAKEEAISASSRHL